MERAREQAFRRLGVLAIVLGGHVLMMLLFSSSRPSDTRKGTAQTEPGTVPVLLDLEARAEEPQVKHTPEAPLTASAGRTRADRPRKPRSNAPIESPGENSGETSGSTAITAPGESGVIPKIDWQLEMEITVRAMTPKMMKEQRRLCAEAERTHAERPPGCTPRYYDKPWRPSGNFLQDMRDPDRPRSSVPDLPGDAFGHAPRPEGYEYEE